MRSVAVAAALASITTAAPCEFVVVPPGSSPVCSDSAAGSASKPFCSLLRANRAVASAVATGCLPVTVRLVPGATYTLNETLVISSAESGTGADRAVTWKADAALAPPGVDADAPAVITGAVPGVAAAASRWNVSRDPRLPLSVVGSVMELDLAAAGIRLPPNASAVSPNDARIELFVNGSRMALARWPNVDPANATASYLRLGKVGGANDTVVGWGDLAGNRPATWTGTPLADVRVHGYFHIGWADDISALSNLDIAARTMTFAKPLHYWPPVAGQWYFWFNIVEELDAPGEWWYDAPNHKLLLFPPSPGGDWQSTVEVSGTSGLVNADGAAYVHFVGLELRASRGPEMLLAMDADHLAIVNCTFACGAGNAIALESSDFEHGARPVTPGHLISGTVVKHMGRGGIVLSGGNRSGLVTSGITVADTTVRDFGEYRFTYQFGTRLAGVGVTVENCEFSGSRHEALEMAGNDHIVQYSRFHHLVTEAHDAGAIHQGRDWTWRGKVIRYNLFDHIGRYAFFPGPDGSLACNAPPTSCIRCGVYLDDHEGGYAIYGNLFAGTEVAGIFMHNGRDVGPPEGGIDNNLFLGAGLGVRISGVHECGTDNATLWDRLAAMPFQSRTWAARYPLLARILRDAPCQPRNNAVGLRSPNAAVAIGPITAWEAEHGWFANASAPPAQGWLSLPVYAGQRDVFPPSTFGVGRNWAGKDPGFVSETPLESLDFRLTQASPLWQLGWQRIPESLIGPFKRPEAAARARAVIDEGLGL